MIYLVTNARPDMFLEVSRSFKRFTQQRLNLTAHPDMPRLITVSGVDHPAAFNLTARPKLFMVCPGAIR